MSDFLFSTYTPRELPTVQLEKLDREYTEWLEETRQKVAIGIAQLERGESLDAEQVIEGILDKFRETKETTQ
jgi:antitoxin ParD1/3/4